MMDGGEKPDVTRGDAPWIRPRRLNGSGGGGGGRLLDDGLLRLA